MALDPVGDVFVCGETFSDDFPTSAAAIQSTLASVSDAFVAKLSSDGNSLVYSTYLGGPGSLFGNFADSIAVDGDGDAYITGYTGSPSFPTTPGAFQVTRRDTARTQAFVSKLNPQGSALIYSTYLGGGGTANDEGHGIAVDPEGSAYVTGETFSANFPVVDPLQGSNGRSPSYRSTDGGATWTGIKSGLTNTVVQDWAIDPIDPSMIFAAGLADGGLFKSSDGGVTWQLSSLEGTSITCLAIDPVDPATIWAGTDGSFLLKSVDGGKTFAQTGLKILDYFGSPVNAPITSVAEAPSGQALYVGTPNGLFKTTDGGASFMTLLCRAADGSARIVPCDPVTASASVTSIVIDPMNEATVYVASIAGTVLTGVLKTTDAGSTWTAMNSGFPDNPYVAHLAIDPKDSLNIYAGLVGDGLYKSTNGGATWALTRAPGGWASSGTGWTLDPENSSTILIGDGGNGVVDGLYKSTDGGVSWEDSSAGLFPNTDRRTLGFVKSLVAYPGHPSIFFMGTDIFTSDDAFVAKLNPAGSELDWSTYLGGSSEDYGAALAVDSSGTAYIVGNTWSGDFRTTPRSLHTNYAGNDDVFVARITSGTAPPPPKVTGAQIVGKNLLIFGNGFGDGAVILLGGIPQRTLNDSADPTTKLIGKKVAKQIPHGSSVDLQVENPDGSVSAAFPFMRAP